MDNSPVVPELCLVRPAARTAAEVLQLLAQQALAAGYVRPSFGAALVEREARFPTGLPTATPIAIPHTDVQHVLRPALAAALLDPPVPFGEMGAGPDRTVEVRVAIALLVTDPAAQVPLLVKVLQAAQHPGWADGLADVDQPGDLADILNGMLALP